jgi:hypothetical protein
MNQPVLIGFGDSWAAGHDLASEEKCYLQLTAEHLGIPYQNFAEGSSSISYMVIQFQNFIDTFYFPKHQYYAVFFLTAQERNFYYDQATKKIIHLGPSSHPRDPYYQNYNNEYGEFVANTTLLALQRLCAIYGIKDYYLAGWQQLNLWKSVDQTKFWKNGKQAITQVFHDQAGFVPLSTLIGIEQEPKNAHFGTTHDHPNQQGHERIAQELINWIKIE